jgi:hypothetical protein
MTIEYKDSKRIVLDTSATFEDDDFAGWTLGTGQSLTAGVLYSPKDSSNVHDIHAFKSYAIGEPDDMVLNWDWKYVGADFKLPFIMLTSDASAGARSSSNAGGYGDPLEGHKRIILLNNNATFQVSYRYWVSGEPSKLEENQASDSATPVADTIYYYQFIKDGNDISVKRYGSIADRTAQTNAQQTITETWTSAGSTGYTGTADLAYITIGSYGNYSGDAGANYIYDFKFYSGVTTPPAKPTDVQDNSILIEKDTGKTFWLTPALATTFSNNFSSTTNFLEQGGGSINFVDTANNELDYDFKRDGSNDSITLDLGSALSDDDWVARWQDDTDTYTTNSQALFAFIGLYSESSASDGDNSQDGIYCMTETSNSGNNGWKLTEADGSILDQTGTGSSLPHATGTRYFELSRVGNTSSRLRISSDSEFSVSAILADVTNSVPAGLTGLQYCGIKNRSISGDVGVKTGSIKNLQIYNGVSSVTPATWTMIPWKHYVHYPVEKLRGLIAGGEDSGRTNVIEYLTIATTGNTTDFGDLTVARAGCEAVGSDLRGIFAGGNPTSGDRTLMDYVTIATTGNATDFGDLTVGRYNPCGVSSYVRGVLAGDDSYGTVMDYITIATLGNAIDFGDLTYGHSSMAGVSDQLLNGSTRGIFGGGAVSGSTHQDAMDYITIATLGNATDFGNLTQARYSPCGVNSDVRGVFCGGYRQGYGDVNTMDYITIDTTGNATDFGDLIVDNQTQAGVSSTTRGVMAGGHDGGKTENIGYITIANTGNETNFGDLSVAKNNCGGI